MAAKLTTFSKFLITSAIVGAVGYGLYYVAKKTDLIPKKENSESLSDVGDAEVIKVGVVTWGGYVGGQYFNGGFKASKESRYYKDYGILVEFIVDDDFNSSREKWKAGKIDVLWTTIDAFPTEVVGLAEYEPKIIFQADWSRGGDAIVVRRGINSVGDLRGKKIAVAQGTPSNTFLLWLLEANDMTVNDVKIINVASAIDAANTFRTNNVDAAVVWSPDDKDCVEKVPGSKILVNTKTATNIIADVFFVKKKYLEKNEKALKALVEGWLKGAAEINSSEDIKKEAAKMLAKNLPGDFPEEFTLNAINNARLCTYGDNLNFFGLNDSYNGVTGEQLYTKMGAQYEKIGLAPASRPPYREIVYSGIIKQINLTGATHSAEGAAEFSKVTEEDKNKTAISSKKVSITFPTGSYKLDENAKYIIDISFLEIAKTFANARIRIEGNTDNTGNPEANRQLSLKRAQAVADYLIKEHGFDPNRFIIVGNGSDKPIADNATEEGRAKNRRTEFQLLN
ncbi:MAG: phosphate ABC transporter substrate-binding/OmpA family protein [Cytophagaceae bacterium]|nr:phosphate ABC transporter substrate-binding/OmpA family protein [Cytophagaceae bacterium]MDW8455987.1 phosphate ABC transporter substrate-binding/OmpA family protein [Cytophagaceae bacterium]